MVTDEQMVQQAAQLGANPVMLEQLLMQVFVPDTDQIKAAEAVLKAYTRDPACVPPLLQQMQSSQHEQARQLAAVLLKKKIMVHWKTFNDQQKEGVKSLLLQAIGTDPSRLARHSVASLIARVAKSLFATPQGWQELLDLVGQCAQHPQSEDHRELAFILLNELTETVGDVLTAHFDVLQKLFLQALKDPSSKVQVAALRACSALLAYLSMDAAGMKFRSLVQPALQVARDCLLWGDDVTVGNILEVFADLSAVGQVAVRKLWCSYDLKLRIGRNGFEDASHRSCYKYGQMVESHGSGMLDTVIVCCSRRYKFRYSQIAYFAPAPAMSFFNAEQRRSGVTERSPPAILERFVDAVVSTILHRCSSRHTLAL